MPAYVRALTVAAVRLQAVRAAAESVLEDPRFYDSPVRFEELPELELEVSVLSPLRSSPHTRPWKVPQLKNSQR